MGKTAKLILMKAGRVVSTFAVTLALLNGGIIGITIAIIGFILLYIFTTEEALLNEELS